MSTPAGWYDDGSGQQRWWDGTAWGPTAPTAQAPAVAEPVQAHGVNGQVTFDGRMIVINRSGALARMTVGKSEKRIPVSSITAVELKPANMTRGYIQFTIPGGNERRRGATEAARDENSVMFKGSQQPAFEALRDAIEACL